MSRCTVIPPADRTARSSSGMHGGGRDRSGQSSMNRLERDFRMRQRQARDAPWSCGNQPAYHSMINRRSVPALHRACLHQTTATGNKTPGGILRPEPLKTDMTAVQTAARGDGGRPRTADQRADRGDAAPGRSRLDHRAARPSDQGAGGRGRARCSPHCLTPVTWRRSTAPIIQANAWWSARTRCWGEERARKRSELLAATEKELIRIQARVQRASKPLHGAAAIGQAVGAVLGRRKMAKHFQISIGDDAFGFARNTVAIAAEAALDGIYVVRTNLPAAQSDAAATVRAYKNLSSVERAFRSMKTVDLRTASGVPLDRATGARARPAVHAGLLSGMAHAPKPGPDAVRRARSGWA